MCKAAKTQKPKQPQKKTTDKYSELNHMKLKPSLVSK